MVKEKHGGMDKYKTSQLYNYIVYVETVVILQGAKTITVHIQCFCQGENGLSTCSVYHTNCN